MCLFDQSLQVREEDARLRRDGLTRAHPARADQGKQLVKPRSLGLGRSFIERV